MKYLAICALTALPMQLSAQSIQLSAGDYVWTSDWGCSVLTIGSTLAYTYDDACDGSIDYTAARVTLDGTVISADDARMIIQSADTNQISGIFVFNGETEATFVRQ